MEGKKYQVLFYGEILPNTDVESVKTNLANAFRVDKSKIETLFSGGKKIVKKDASRDLCEKTKKVFESAGAVVAVVPQAEKPAPTPTDVEPPAKTAAAPMKTVIAASSPPPDTTAEKQSSGKIPAENVSKTALLLLTFFLGGFGIHKFYLARNIQGILYFLFCWTGIPFFVSLVDFFIYVFTDEEKLNSRYKTGSTPLIIIMAVFGPFFLMVIIGIMAAIAIPLIIVSQGDIASPLIKIMASSQTATGNPVTVPLRRERSATKSAIIPTTVAAHPESDAAACSGKIQGLDFSVEHASIQNGVLHLGQGKDLFADREMIIFMFLEDKDVSNQRIHVSGGKESFSDPHIHLRWKTGNDNTPHSDVAMKGYDLDLEFGQVTGKTVRGKINLTIPGDRETRLAGTFIAEVTDQ